MTERAAWLRFLAILVFVGRASPACTEDESVADESTGGDANHSGGYVSDAGASSGVGGRTNEGGAAGYPYVPEPSGAAGVPFGNGGASGQGPSSAHAGDSATAGANSGDHSPQAGSNGAGACGEFRGDGGASGALPQGVEGAYCECDGVWNACYIEPEQFCYGPPELGCGPSLETLLGVLKDEPCARGTYSACPDHRILIQLEYHSPSELEYEFDELTGMLMRASAFPVGDCGFLSAPLETYYFARRKGPQTDPETCTFICGFGREGSTCDFSGGPPTLPPDTGGAGGEASISGGAGGEPSTSGGAAGASQGGQAGVD